MRRSLLLAVCLFLLSSASRSYVFMKESRWPEATATFHPTALVLLGKERSPSGVRWIDAFREAAQEWNDKTAFDFEIDTARPSHPCAGVLPEYPEDYQNGVAFTSVICAADAQGNSRVTSFGEGVLGVTLVYSELVYRRDGDTWTLEGTWITETDIFFNDQEALDIWDIYDGPKRLPAFDVFNVDFNFHLEEWGIYIFSERPGIDFRRVALHELGHALGLGHESRKPAIMAPFYSGNLYHLQQDDIAGVAALYGSAVPDNK